jgi:hypothetical protein
VLPIDARRARRARRRPNLSPIERLEERQLLAYTALGFSLPDLVVSGQTPPVATYGGPISVNIDVQNLGASSLVEPLSLYPGAASTADAPPSNVGVYLATAPRFNPFARNVVKIGDIPIPGVLQNSKIEVSSTLTMPAQPRGFPGDGGQLFVFFRADDLHQMNELDRTNDVAIGSQPVQIAAPLPDLAAIAIDVPAVMQPGDVIAPEIKVANFGTVNTNTQGPLTVDLVASSDPNFGPGDVILDSVQVPSLPPLSVAPSQFTVLGDATLDDPANVVSLQLPQATLPLSTTGYFIGVIVDPFNQIREIREIGAASSPALNPLRVVGAPIPGLPPAGVLSAPAPTANLFPVPAFGPLATLTNPGTGGLAAVTSAVATAQAEFGTPGNLFTLAQATGGMGGSSRLAARAARLSARSRLGRG